MYCWYVHFSVVDFFVKNVFICSLLFPEDKIVQSMHKIIKYIQQKNVKHKLVLNIGLA